MGTVHARNALGLPAARLVAVASTRSEVTAAAAAELGVRGSSYEELFAADDVDAVVLAARSIDHAERAVTVLRAGKHLFLEKPGATTVAGQAAVREAARTGQVVQVGYHRRFDPRWAEARRLVEEGAIGRPLVVFGVARDVRTPADWTRSRTTPRSSKMPCTTFSNLAAVSLDGSTLCPRSKMSLASLSSACAEPA